MKIMTILGTRPEIIRLSLVIRHLDSSCEHVLVHTGQNFDSSLSEVFFRQLGIREPDYYLGVHADTFGRQVAEILSESERVLRHEKPDRLLILGDTDSGLSALVAKRLGIPVFHMEAGNRCYDDRVPEEVNRRVIDHCSDVLMPYTERSRQNLLREGIASDRVYVIGNPINEVIKHYEQQILQSSVLEELGLEARHYFLVTLHRAENVDSETRLLSLLAGISDMRNQYGFPIVFSTHPRTRNRLKQLSLEFDEKSVRMLPPFAFFEFIRLEQNAFCVLSDSGTVQEECCILRVPNVTLRDVTERPETIEVGSNVLSGSEPEMLARCVRTVVSHSSDWRIPDEYLAKSVSRTVLKIVLGYTDNIRL